MSDQPPDLLASDAERDRAAGTLHAAHRDGRLTTAELEERLQAVYAARTRGQLEPLLADVPAAPPNLSPATTGGGTRLIVSVMSGTSRRGHWRVSKRCTVLDVMGGTQLDLTDAELAPEGTTINVVCVMGGSKIRVPEGARVHVSKLALLGGNDVRLDEPGAVQADGPVIRLRLLSIMGGVSVRQGKRKRAQLTG